VTPLHGLVAGGTPEAWAAAGFTVAADRIRMGEVTVQVTGGPESVVAWTLPDVDGLTHADVTSAAPSAHPNTTTAIDHVVIASPDLDRTTEALTEAGLDLRRTRDAGRMEQRFFRAGEVILEVIGRPGAHQDGPATFWGLALTAADLDAAASLLGDHLGPVTDAVQPGRRIATLRHEPLGLGVPIAFLTPHPPRDPA
jgi:hypothetical protein